MTINNYQKTLTGIVWKFGDNIDTDVIIPGKYLRTTDFGIFATHVMEAIDPQFPKKVEKGDVIVAGENFGCGSSREQAPLALKYAGVACVVARSFARIFFRNAINVGLPIIEAGVDCMEGDIIQIDMRSGIIVHEGVKYQATKLPDFLQEILADGGLVEHRKKIGVV